MCLRQVVMCKIIENVCEEVQLGAENKIEQN